MIYVIGNGESRRDIDISKLVGFKIGCNGIYLHEHVDMICAMDVFWRDKIVKETNIPLLSRSVRNSFQPVLQIYDKHWIDTPVTYKGYCSGITALDYVSYMMDDDITLLGFDFGYKGETVNHIYKDTPNHPKSDRKAQNEDIFYQEALKVFKMYPNKSYTWIGDSDLFKLNNVKRQSIWTLQNQSNYPYY